MSIEPKFISGGSHIDNRGTISFVNGFNLNEAKRLYAIEHNNKAVVRAWQGHKDEQKWFYVVAGSFKVVVVKPDNWENPSKYLPTKEFLLTTVFPGVLHIPAGYANGFKALETGSKIIVFSDFTVEQSSNDNYRFDQDLWFDWNKI
ncbi:WxcM-like domain-containing protein [Pedobacter polysacchareus]|uniref:WxcM-like domain-containing protein n=1 Tax=Pedobacter polysacchareus TaxID=2861973 RepID=UPI001C99C5E3|nr:WxcM-like domain-containing protein [Pedobacter polysacchareus]